MCTQTNTFNVKQLQHKTADTWKPPHSERAKRQLSCRRPFQTHSTLLRYVLDKDRAAQFSSGSVEQGFPFSNIEPRVVVERRAMSPPTPTCGIWISQILCGICQILNHVWYLSNIEPRVVGETSDVTTTNTYVWYLSVSSKDAISRLKLLSFCVFYVLQGFLVLIVNQ